MIRRILMTTLLLTPAALHAGDAPKPARPMLFAAYYVWYHAGDCPFSGASQPLAGLYDSADPAVAQWHVRLAKAAGIDAFLVSWWDKVKERDQAFEKGVFAAAEKLGFRIALLDERAQFHAKREDYEAMLSRTLRKYKDSPAYLRLGGRPVVYLYQVASQPGLSLTDFAAVKRHVEAEAGPVYWIVDKLAHDSRAQRSGDEDRVKCIPAEWLAAPGIDSFAFYSTFSHFRAHRYEELAGKYRYVVKLAHDAGKKMFLPVHPGYDNTHLQTSGYVMPRRNGQTFRDYLRAAANAGADYILVTSWNEWPETTTVEPSSTWPDPYLYLKILAEWKGVSFIAPPLP